MPPSPRPCPNCDKPLLQSMRSDFCPACLYEQRYEDAHRDTDPGGDFEGSEDYE